MPPFVGVAENVTLVPEQIVLPGDAAILTEAVTFSFTAMVMPFDVAVAGLAHASEEVIITVTTSPFVKVLLK